MNILVVGAHFNNKGAHLMMEAVLEEFDKHDDTHLFVSPTIGTKQQIQELGYGTIDYPLKHVADQKSFEIFLKHGGLIKFLKKKFRGNLKLNQIDAVLDISGFAFSDQWGLQSVINVNSLIKFFKKRGVKYIFLPQAFGPFTSEEIKSSMKQVLKNCDLVMARDKISYDILKSLSDDSTIKQYPDITLSLKEKKSENNFGKYCCIVPNERMMDQGREYWPEGKYETCLNEAIRTLSERKNKVLILLHDNGMGDVRLVTSLNEKFKDNDLVNVVIEDDPMKLKSLLGKANIVIGSRFHALVSALSQNVPCLALGWSHKYNMLFEEYGLEDFSFTQPDDERFQIKLDELMNEEKQKEIKHNIAVINKALYKTNREMWSEVLEVLKS